MQVALELKSRKVFTRTSPQVVVNLNNGQFIASGWSQWKEETSPISEIPTKLSQLENDKNYVDINKVNELILQASGLKKEVHDNLPTQEEDEG